MILQSLLTQGANIISLRIDNRVIIPVGVNSHSISDHTQSNWNGITGDISLRATSPSLSVMLQIYPDIQKKAAKIIVSINNPDKIDFKGKLTMQAQASILLSGSNSIRKM